jgi:hypothetical protein
VVGLHRLNDPQSFGGCEDGLHMKPIGLQRQDNDKLFCLELVETPCLYNAETWQGKTGVKDSYQAATSRDVTIKILLTGSSFAHGIISWPCTGVNILL